MNSLNRRNSISEEMLAPHLRHKTTMAGMNTAGVDERKSKTAGVEIIKGNLVFVGEDGRLYLADINGHYAEYIALNTGMMDETIYYDYRTELEYNNSEAIIYGDVLFLSSIENNINISKTPPVGGVYQVVGIALSNNLVYYNINDYYILE